MADQGKWAKLWVNVLADPELENLELHNWARWARLLIFIKAHGTDGKLMITEPCRSLQNTLRMTSFEELISLLLVLPSFTLKDASTEALQEPSQSALQDVKQHLKRYMIVVNNWNKYQGDFSVERVRRHRAKNSVTGSVTGNGESNGLRREEKRRDLKSTSLSSSKPPSAVARSGASPRSLPLQETKVEEVEQEQEFGHEEFKQTGWRKTDQPKDSFGWEHIERSLDQTERVQSKWREKTYHERKWN